MAHRDAVGDRDGAKLLRVAAGSVYPVLDRLGQAIQGEVAGGDLVPAGGDTDLRLDPVLVSHTDRAQHAAGSGGLQAVGDHSGTGLDVDAVAGCRVGSLGCDALLSHDGQSSRLAGRVRLDPVCLRWAASAGLARVLTTSCQASPTSKITPSMGPRLATSCCRKSN